ncbi:MAG: hypothetical protein IPJ78_14450 [Gemmatimonadetes bacterium]|nr:hypothetical protein [Gemmatimonadota bacterium]
MSDIQSLLALQNDDLAIHDLETRLAALEPRIRELDARRQRIVDTIERQSGMVAGEEKKQAFLRDKIQEHRGLIDRNQAQLDAVKTMRQATAAAAQMEQAKKIVAGEESDLLALSRKLEELRGVLTAAKKDLEACEAEQAAARTEVAAERATIDGALRRRRRGGRRRRRRSRPRSARAMTGSATRSASSWSCRSPRSRAARATPRSRCSAGMR